MPEKLYFLPKVFADALQHESAAGVSFAEAFVEVEGFKIPGFTIAGEDAAVQKFLGEAPIYGFTVEEQLARAMPFRDDKLPANDLKEVGRGRVDNQEYTILGRKSFVAEMFPEAGSRIIDYHEVQQDVLKTFHQLSSWSGMSIIFYSPETPSARVYTTHKDGIQIVIDASPPGEARTQNSIRLCQIQIADHGEWIEHAGPTLGRGRVVYDTDKHPIAQIVDGTLYLFVPLTIERRHVLLEQGAGLLKKVLRAAWNAQYEDTQPTDEVVIKSAEAYCSLMEARIRETPDVVRMTLPMMDKDIELAEEELRRCIRRKRDVLAAIRLHEVAIHNIDHGRWTKDWEELSSLPDVRQITSVERGLHVETNLIVSSYGGQRRPLGRYMIRIGYGGAAGDSGIWVWCVETKNPSGYAHPHIGITGKPCFGNITIAIQKAAMENRCHAVKLALGWLRDGYDPGLADVDINEWPVEKQ